MGISPRIKTVFKESTHDDMMIKIVEKKKNILKQFIFHKPCVSSHVLSFHLYGISGVQFSDRPCCAFPSGDASVELREQALTGGAALAALAQSLTSLVGVSPEVGFLRKKKAGRNFDVF